MDAIEESYDRDLGDATDIVIDLLGIPRKICTFIRGRNIVEHNLD